MVNLMQLKIEGRDTNMAEVDPASGLPISQVEKKSDMERFNRLSEQKARSDQLVEDINSEKGQMVLNKVKEHLLNRVNKLIDEDGECKALKKLLIDMGLQINVGEMAADRLMRLVMKKEK